MRPNVVTIAFIVAAGVSLYRALASFFPQAEIVVTTFIPRFDETLQIWWWIKSLGVHLPKYIEVVLHSGLFMLSIAVASGGTLYRRLIAGIEEAISHTEQMRGAAKGSGSITNASFADFMDIAAMDIRKQVHGLRFLWPFLPVYFALLSAETFSHRPLAGAAVFVGFVLIGLLLGIQSTRFVVGWAWSKVSFTARAYEHPWLRIAKAFLVGTIEKYDPMIEDVYGELLSVARIAYFGEVAKRASLILLVFFVLVCANVSVVFYQS